MNGFHGDETDQKRNGSSFAGEHPGAVAVDGIRQGDGGQAPDVFFRFGQEPDNSGNSGFED